MARTRPAERLDHLVESAARIFTEKGYRRAQMADVARDMGVAPGTLYLYVESKEALFDLVVQRAFAGGPEPEPAALPLPTPAPQATLEHLRARARAEGALPRLDAALARTRVADVADELRDIVRELYDSLSRSRAAVRLMERSALDWPELAAVWFGEIRRELLRRLRLYLERRIAARKLRPVASIDATARLVLETVAWCALHRHGDPEPPPESEATMADATVDFVVAALLRHEDR